MYLHCSVLMNSAVDVAEKQQTDQRRHTNSVYDQYSPIVYS